MNKLITSPAPHFRKTRTTTHVMGDVLLALLPTAVMAVYAFGIRALILFIVCVGSSVLFELLYEKLMKKPVTIKDLSAAVTGILLAFCLPSHLPLWMAVLGSFFAVVVTKQLFGGLGRNFANPALVGRIFLMVSFGNSMINQYINPYLLTSAQKMMITLAPADLDAVVGATALSGTAPTSLFPAILWQMGSSLGEVSAAALIAGLIFLLVKKVITITIPASYIATVALVSFVLGENVLFQVLTGGLLLGAIFMATDYVTSPTTESGKLIYGVLCGVITMFIRMNGSFGEGVSFAILLMNILTPFIDNITQTKPLGGLTSNE